MQIKIVINQELQKLSTLTTKEKLEHIWEYYKIQIGVVIFIIYVIGWGVNHYIVNPPRSTYFNVSFYGSFVPQDIRANLIEHTENTMELNIDRYEIQSLSFFFTDDPQQRMAANTQFGVMLGAREFDILIVHKNYMQSIEHRGFAANLDYMLPNNVLEQLANDIYFGNRYQTSPLEHIEPIIEESGLPLGINLSGIQYFTNKSPIFDEFILIIMANTTRYEAVISFIKHILNFK